METYSDPESYIKLRKSAKRIKVPNHPNAPEIEKGIALPLEARGGLRKLDHYYPFEDMEIGDSFWVPSLSQCTSGAISKFSKKSGWSFISRGQSKDGTFNKVVMKKSLRGTRVWRTK